MPGLIPVMVSTIVVIPISAKRLSARVLRLRRGRVRQTVATCLNQLFQFASVQPDSTADRAHVKLNPATVDCGHCAVVVRTKQEGHFWLRCRGGYWQRWPLVTKKAESMVMDLGRWVGLPTMVTARAQTARRGHQ